LTTKKLLAIVAQLDPNLIQTLIVAGGSVTSALVIIRLAHRGLLTFRYTVGWIGLLLIGILSSAFIRIAEPISSSLGVTPGVVVMAIGVAVLLAICIQLSISISGLQANLRRATEEIALVCCAPAPSDINTSLLVIVPAFNEAQTVGGVVAELRHHQYDVLVIDDGSRDETSTAARTAGAAVVTMPYNTGVGGALRTGLQYAVRHNYDTVVQCDADGQHPVSHVRDLVNELAKSSADMVIGSRFANGPATAMHIPPLRRLAMWTLARTASHSTGNRITDVTSGFRAFDRELVIALARHLPAYYLGDTYEAVVAAGRSGYKVSEIPCPIGERIVGTSTASSIKAAQMTVRVFLTAILHLHVRLPSKATR